MRQNAGSCSQVSLGGLGCGISVDAAGNLSTYSNVATAATTIGPPTKLAFIQGPTNTAAGATITPAVTVAVEDANGNVETSDNATVAGLVPAGGKLVKASWPAILDGETWEAMKAKLEDPGRTTTTGNEPKHLLSGLAHCWCGGEIRTNGLGRGRAGAAYVCTQHAHLRRNAAGADEWVALHITEYLDRADNRDLLRPPARPGVDAPALRAQAARLDAIGNRQARMHAMGEISDSEMRAGSRARKSRLDEIAAQLAATTTPDPLAEFRDQPDAAAVWATLPLPRKRAVARLLVTVILLPATRRGPGFDPDSVRVEPVTQ